VARAPSFTTDAAAYRTLSSASSRRVINTAKQGISKIHWLRAVDQIRHLCHRSSRSLDTAPCRSPYMSNQLVDIECGWSCSCGNVQLGQDTYPCRRTTSAPSREIPHSRRWHRSPLSCSGTPLLQVRIGSDSSMKGLIPQDWLKGVRVSSIVS